MVETGPLKQHACPFIEIPDPIAVFPAIESVPMSTAGKVATENRPPNRVGSLTESPPFRVGSAGDPCIRSVDANVTDPLTRHASPTERPFPRVRESCPVIGDSATIGRPNCARPLMADPPFIDKEGDIVSSAISGPEM